MSIIKDSYVAVPSKEVASHPELKLFPGIEIRFVETDGEISGIQISSPEGGLFWIEKSNAYSSSLNIFVPKVETHKYWKVSGISPDGANFLKVCEDEYEARSWKELMDRKYDVDLLLEEQIVTSRG